MRTNTATVEAPNTAGVASDYRYAMTMTEEVPVLVRFNWNPGSPASWECPGEPPHIEDAIVLVQTPEGEAEIVLPRAQREALIAAVADAFTHGSEGQDGWD